MGNHVQRPRFIEWDLNQLEKVTNLSKDQYIELYHKYQNDEAWGGKNMDKHLFFEKYDELLPGQQTKKESDRAFQTFDYNNSGKLSYEEFVGLVIILNNGSTMLDRVAYLIDQYNPNKCEHLIQEEYGKFIFDRLNRYFNVENLDAAAIWTQFFSNHDNSRGQFLSFIQHHPIYQKYFQ